MTHLTYRYVALTDTGLRRSENQDSGLASDRLLAIADGMGGAAAGDLASATTMLELRKLVTDASWADGGQAQEALAGAVSRANHRLADLIADDPSVEGMGTTLEALLWDGSRFAWAHIGDSRAYRLRDGHLEQVSVDHTFVQSLVEEGRLTPAEARTHPHRSLILRALLGRDDNDPDISWIEPKAGDRYLLCSDGLTDMVEDAAIERTLGSENIDAAATELVRLALEGGGVDNVTVVIAEVVDDHMPPADDLVCADGRPQLVGAAANLAQGPTGHGATGSGKGRRVADTEEEPQGLVDPEELRYAPRAPSRMRWARGLLALVVVAAVLGVAGWFGYRWTQDQYYVGASGDDVAIFRGVQVDVPGLTLHRVDEVTEVTLESLPDYNRKQVESGIEARDRDEADQIVQNLQSVAVAPEPSATPTPTRPTRTPSASRSTDTSALGPLDGAR